MSTSGVKVYTKKLRSLEPELSRFVNPVLIAQLKAQGYEEVHVNTFSDNYPEQFEVRAKSTFYSSLFNINSNEEIYIIISSENNKHDSKTNILFSKRGLLRNGTISSLVLNCINAFKQAPFITSPLAKAAEIKKFHKEFSNLLEEAFIEVENYSRLEQYQEIAQEYLKEAFPELSVEERDRYHKWGRVDLVQEWIRSREEYNTITGDRFQLMCYYIHLWASNSSRQADPYTWWWA